ncbi:DUF262 domain-containing protein [Pseudomonas sp. HMWF032]|uniref:DUF262 domain-containing protein n=1 Tax=Pseudomonas sp. HMWF032 TaxID=2056866 RepID=UPI000D338F37|nr:DUF262 domain-containing protein [Pseudomonas sp. HMWF032]PTS85785.1 DUF262 domain-containing protein [Pseudomonas sp. HMWF032]PTT86069.1 DUF262 domain-containing protein [Pseudomonas sp. HMWF010]
MKIESTDKDVRSILQSGYYGIPRFQRPYSWEKEHVLDFWNDIVVESDDDYFIGSMVVYRQEKGYYGVVDGQQRLTTLTIMLSTLRNVMNDLEFKDLALGVHSLIERNNIDNIPEYVLTTESSYPYMQEHIQKFGPPDLIITPLEEEKTLQNALKLTEELINSEIKVIKETPSPDPTSERIYSRLKSIRDRLLDLKVIFIELDNEDDAYLIFETLNTRGKDLNCSDLIKNHLSKLLKAHNSNVDATKEKWSHLRKVIEESNADLDIDSFLHHFWLSKFDFITQKKLFKEIKKTVGKDEAKSFLEQLIQDSETYRAIHEPEFRTWKKEESNIVLGIEALNLFRVKLQTPTVLSVLREYFAGDLSKASAERMISAISRFHFIFTTITSQRSSGGVSQMYASYAKRLSKAEDTQAKNLVINELKDKLRQRIPSYEEFSVNFSQVLYTKKLSKQKRLAQYILSTMHRHEHVGYPVDYENMTIEHLYPENPKSIKKLEDKIVGKLGNLILIDQSLNEKLANKDFSSKKEILLSHGVKLDEYIINATKWDEEKITERTNALAEKAYSTVWNF